MKGMKGKKGEYGPQGPQVRSGPLRQFLKTGRFDNMDSAVIISSTSKAENRIEQNSKFCTVFLHC